LTLNFAKYIIPNIENNNGGLKSARKESMKDFKCKRLVWVRTNLLVPVEYEGKLEDWHDAFIKFMREKNLQEHSASELDSNFIICEGCGDDLTLAQANEVNDQMLCDKCENDYRSAMDDAADEQAKELRHMNREYERNLL